MAQTYFPLSSRSASPTAITETSLVSPDPIALAASPQDVQEAYIQQKNRLVSAIDATKSILNDVKEYSKSWIVRYPQFQQSASVPEVSTSRPHTLRRSLSFADDPSTANDVVLSSTRGGLRRSLTLASIADVAEEVESNNSETLPESEFQVLRLDLKLGPTTTTSSLVTQLEKASITNLLNDRIQASLTHIDKLRARVEDTSSKVLVTGDLNAGKSTLVNALLRREIMPVDQQPCTTLFCEVHPAVENGGVEEVHIIKEGATYNIADESTFTRAPLSDLDALVSESDAQHVLKLYVNDTRDPQASLLQNGIVDITLIDAPGLNRDSLKTTALFARQEEIDVVVFVVSAENHFTLSAKEFLWNASNEKAYLFIVVNRFDQIRDKERCKRLVLEQIKQLSPRTWEDAADLVHFVDSSNALHSSATNGAFDHLESSLRSFVLIKRSKSKLNPATTYLGHVLADIDLLAGANAIVAAAERDEAREALGRVRPVLEKMKRGREGLEDALEATEEDNARASSSRTHARLTDALERVGQGELPHESSIRMPEYPGLLHVWEYARQVRRALLASLDHAVKMAEDEARVITANGVKAIASLAEQHLPEGVERSKRVFMPEAMFSPRARDGKGGRKLRSKSAGALVHGGVQSVGLGLAQRSELLDVTFFDIFDAQHHFTVHFASGKDKEAAAAAAAHREESASALGAVSVGMGALTMVGGKAVGLRGIVETVVRLTDWFGNERTRRWVAPVLGAVLLGATVYVVLDLPYAIPRTVGRRVRVALLAQEKEGHEEEGWIRGHEVRIGRETRKVLRLAAWDVRERHKGAIDENGKVVKEAEDLERKSQAAVDWFGDVSARTGAARSQAGLVGETD